MNEEEELMKKCAEYARKFGQQYPIFITSTISTDEHIRRIDNAISSGNPCKSERVEKGKVY